MSAHVTTLAAALSRAIAAMPSRTVYDCQEQDLAVASALELIAAACEGNGDAAQILTRAIEDIRSTVAVDRRETEAA